MARIFLIICLGVLWNSFNGLSQTTMSANTILQDNGTYMDPNGFSNYSNSSNITQTICPSVAGQCVTLQFLEFNLEANFDYLRIYDGITTSTTNLIATLTGNYLPTNFTSTSGCLTLIFTSDSNVSSSGWFANILTNPCGTTPTPPPSPVSTSDAFQAINICTNPTFLLDPANNGLLTEFTVGSISNPSVNPASSNAGCLLTGEVNSTWLIVNIASTGTLEFSFGAPSTSTNKCLDWIMWPYNGAPTMNLIMNNSLPPVRCNWNASCQGFTGIANSLPIGSNQGDFEPALQVTCGQKFIICLSNWNALNTVIPIQFFGTAGISCSTVNGLQVNSPTICEGQSANLIATGATSYLWSNGVATSTQTVAPTTTTTLTVTGQSDCGLTSQAATITVIPLPIINAGQDTTVCSGSSVTLIGSGGNSYSWNNGVSDNVPFSVNQTQTYTLTSSIGGCTATDQVVINVIPLPAVNAGLDQQICEGESTFLQGTGAPQLQWDQGMTSGSIFTPSLGLHTYTLTGTSAEGCVKSDQIQIIVHENPTVSAGNDLTICQGQSISLQASGAINYQWSNSVQNNTPFIPTIQGVYTVTGTNIFGCTNTDNLSITINSLPIVNAGNDLTICAGESIILSGNGASQLSWNNSVIDGQSFSPTSTTVYTLTGTNNQGCVASDQLLVTVNALPTPYINGSINYCSLSSVNLTTNTSYASYNWSTGSTSSSTSATSVNNPISVTVTDNYGCTASSPLFNVYENNLISTFQTITICEGEEIEIHGIYQSSAGVYIDSIFTPQGCDSVSTVTLIVNQAPQVSAGLDTSICFGASYLFNAQTNGLLNWQGGFINNQIIQPAIGIHQYIANASSLQGCGNTDTVTVIVYSLPSVQAGMDTSICIGNSVILQGTGASNYSWSNGITNGTTISPLATTNYSLIGTDENGCSNNDQLTITVHPLPQVYAGLDQTICEGDQLLMNGSGAANYTWSSGNNNGDLITPPIGTTIYAVVGTSTFGCINTDAFQVIVHELPEIEAGIDVEVCENMSVLLSASGGLNYSWNNSISNNQAFIAPIGTTVYTVTGTSNVGCTNTDQVAVVVHPLPSIQAGTDLSICLGDTVVLMGQGGFNYQWSNSINNGVPFIPSSTSSYTLTGVSQFGCVNSDNLIITVNPIPNVNAGNDTSICFGESITLIGTGATSYTWNNGVTNNMSFIPLQGTHVYTVVGTTNQGCINSDSLIVTVKSLPIIQFEADATSGCIPKTVHFLNETENTQSCSWKFGTDSSIGNYSDAAYTFTAEGCYDVSLEVLGTNGCSTNSIFTNYICVEDAPNVSFTPSTEIVNQLDGTVYFYNTTEGATSYTWNFGDSSLLNYDENPTHDFIELPYGNYMVKLIASSSMGCIDSNFVIIKMDEESIFFIPNTFTPNQDEMNTVFLPVFTDGFDPYNFSIRIFNRWGELIFESNDARLGWNGLRFNEGEMVQDGIYTWSITYKKIYSAETTQLNGHVTLIR